MKDPLKKYIDDHRKDFDNLEVPEDAFGKIMAQLNENKTSETKTRTLFSHRIWAVAASVVLLLSLGIYRFWPEKHTSKPMVAIEESPKTSSSNSVETNSINRDSEYIASPKTKLKSELKIAEHSVPNHSDKNRISHINSVQSEQKTESNDSDKEVLHALELMNNQQSASSRLRGIELAKNISDSDQSITKLLTNIAVHDENTNVRLAAVDALSQELNHSEMMAKMQQIFLQQNDPMVQRELMAIFAQTENSQLNPETNAKLQSIAKDPTSERFVKDEAYAILMK